MSNFEVSEIERDLVRWPRAKWVAVVLCALAVEAGLLFTASGPQEALVPPSDRTLAVTFNPPENDLEPGSELEDPNLFASAHLHGFSGPGWMIKTPWSSPPYPPLPGQKFLAFDAAKRIDVRPEIPLAAWVHTRAPSKPAEIVLPPAEARASSVEFESADVRELQSIPVLPTQYASDAVGASVVQVLIDPDGLVISARLLTASGSKSADADALAIARKARFTPGQPGSGGGEVWSGTLRFRWQALPLPEGKTTKP